MGFCSSCGTAMGDGVKFCPSCGAPAGSAAPAKAPKPGLPLLSHTTQLPHHSDPLLPPTHTTPHPIPFPLSSLPLFCSAAKPGSAKGGAIASSLGANDLSPVVEQLKVMYKQKILPLEKDYKFEDFHSPGMTDTDFDAKPMVLLIGQYSTGKTTFIKYLLERDFPGAHIGPEPTTDRFVAVMHGADERIIPGNALAADASKPFTALNKFGMAFLNKVSHSALNNTPPHNTHKEGRSYEVE